MITAQIKLSLSYNIWFVLAGDSQAGKLWNEQSQVVVETVTKSTTTQMFSAAQLLHDADVSKVRSEGVGLQKAFINKDATFTVDTSQAGMYNLQLTSYVGFSYCLKKRLERI